MSWFVGKLSILICLFYPSLQLPTVSDHSGLVLFLVCILFLVVMWVGVLRCVLSCVGIYWHLVLCAWWCVVYGLGCLVVVFGWFPSYSQGIYVEFRGWFVDTFIVTIVLILVSWIGSRMYRFGL